MFLKHQLLLKIAILAGIVIMVITVLFMRRTNPKPTISVQPLSLEDTDPTFVPATWRMFFNPEFKFTIMYPTGYTASGSASKPLVITPVVDPNRPAPDPVLTAIVHDGNLESAIEYLRGKYVVEEIERLPYARYVKIVAHEKERPEAHTEYFIRSNNTVAYILFGWQGIDWKYTANVASSVEFEK